MTIKFIEITPTLSVAEQLDNEDIRRAAKFGFRSIICNRPDGEEGGYLSALAANSIAAKHGMKFKTIPAYFFELSDTDIVDEMTQALAELPGPVLAYCKSGARSAALWAMTSAGYIDIKSILQCTDEAGFDLSLMEDELLEREQYIIRTTGKKVAA